VSVADSPERASGAGSRWRTFALLFLVVTLVGLLNFGIQVTSWRAERAAEPAKYALAWELTGAYSFFVLLPLLLAFFARWPITAANALRRVPLYLVVMVSCSVVQTLLMWGSRSVLYDWLGWGRYEYGDMRYRFAMEGLKLLLAYTSTYAIYSIVAGARRAREAELRTARLERELTEARLHALQMQLKPHFLFNTLNMISSHVHEDPAIADAMIGQLADFLRLTLRQTQEQEVPLERELELTGAYLAIMRARFEERLSITLEVAPEARAALVPQLVLQPLVENSVTHCMEDASGIGTIAIRAHRLGERLVLVIEDNGPGLAGAAEVAVGRGIGLGNTDERLRHLYGGAYRLELANRPQGGLRLVIEMPFRTVSARAQEAR
jgi:two-component system LytT family sensor kinase